MILPYTPDLLLFSTPDLLLRFSDYSGENPMNDNGNNKLSNKSGPDKYSNFVQNHEILNYVLRIQPEFE